VTTIVHWLGLLLQVMILVLALGAVVLALVLRHERSHGPVTWLPESDSAGRELPATRVHEAVAGSQPAAITATRILSPAEAREARETRHHA
jgi:hypothetical protein